MIFVVAVIDTGALQQALKSKLFFSGSFHFIASGKLLKHISCKRTHWRFWFKIGISLARLGSAMLGIG